MAEKKVRFKIFRYKPGAIDPPRYDTFEVPVGPRTVVLDVLEDIRVDHDPSLMYRHSCHHASCGTCAYKINGQEGLGCVTNVMELGTDEVVVEPLDALSRVVDLVVDMSEFYRDISPDWTYLRESEWYPESATAPEVEHHVRFENCIECGACVSSCPVTAAGDFYMGPAALALINRELSKGNGAEAGSLLDLAGSERGVWQCHTAFECSAVCPSDVNPAGHIMELRRRLIMQKVKNLFGLK
ncbi:MAG: succinate dehydrogenase/fumarate reductase iron-sulfur subunit [Anaerolineae bacterium]|nr:succinate dehydrogenase/fumarate reductase iron-sulfur subunit [Anaerolineae bacterium]